MNWLVPLRVTVFTPAPVKLPCRTSYGATLTCTCSIASSEIGATPVRSPMPPVVTPRPNELLNEEPSTVMLFARLSWPAKVPNPPYCGVRRVMSVMRPEIVGSEARSSRVTAVAAPVRFELNTGSITPTTSTLSETAATFMVNSMSVRDAEVQRDVIAFFGGKPAEFGSDLVGPAHAHAGDGVPSVALADPVYVVPEG